MAPALTPARRAVAASLLFLAAAALAGVTPHPEGVEYRAAGLVEGILGLYLGYVLFLRGVWLRPPGALGWVAAVYGVLANAQLATLLLPPAGVLQWMVVTGLAFSAFAALAARSPARLLAGLAAVALLLALLKFSVVPVLWAHAGPAAGTAWGLGDLADSFRRLFVDYRPLRPGGELPGVLAIAAWCAGTRVLWGEGVRG
jgi:hypothetical protein